jgi:hypothetical protein
MGMAFVELRRFDEAIVVVKKARPGHSAFSALFGHNTVFA